MFLQLTAENSHALLVCPDCWTPPPRAGTNGPTGGPFFSWPGGCPCPQGPPDAPAPQERQHYEQALAELTRASPRYVEEMESVFEQGQEFEQRRIEFLKEALAALQRRLDPTAHPG